MKTIKKVLSVLLTVIMLVGILPLTQISEFDFFDVFVKAAASDADPEQWNGTSVSRVRPDSSNVYHIYTASELKYIQSLVTPTFSFEGCTIKLENDIYLNNKEWMPIGSVSLSFDGEPDRYFAGSFDGNNHTVYGLKCVGATSYKTKSPTGLFSYVKCTSDCYFKNVTVRGSISGAGEHGGLVGNLIVEDGVTVDFENITTRTSISNPVTIFADGNGLIGGLIGNLTLQDNANINISNCKQLGNLSSGLLVVGGFVGNINATKTSNISFYRCLQNSVVRDVGSYSYNSGTVGGIIGMASNGNYTIKECAVNGEIWFKGYGQECGGFIGKIIPHSISMEDCEIFAYIHTEHSNGNSGMSFVISGCYADNYDEDSEWVIRNILISSVSHGSGAYGSPPVTGMIVLNQGAAEALQKLSVYNCYLDKGKTDPQRNTGILYWVGFLSGGSITDKVYGSAYYTSEKLKTDHTLYSNWDTETVWDYADSGYPYLRAFDLEPCASHTYSASTTPATCTATGTRVYTCTKCKYSYSETIPVIDHIWDTGTITTMPAENTPGVITFKCTMCGITRTESVEFLAAFNDLISQGIHSIRIKTHAVRQGVDTNVPAKVSLFLGQSCIATTTAVNGVATFNRNYLLNKGVDIVRLASFGTVSAEYETDDYILYSENTDPERPTIPIRTFIDNPNAELVLDKYCKKFNISVAYETGIFEEAYRIMSEFREAFWEMTSGRCVIGGISWSEVDPKKIENASENIIIRAQRLTQALPSGFGNGGHIYLGVKSEPGQEQYNRIKDHKCNGAVVAHEAGHFFFGFRDEYCYGGESKQPRAQYKYDFNEDGVYEELRIIYTESNSLPSEAQRIDIDNMPDYIDIDVITTDLFEIDESTGTFRGDTNQDGIINGSYYCIPKWVDEADDSYIYNVPLVSVCVIDENSNAGYWSKDYLGENTGGVLKRYNSSFGIMDSNYERVRMSTSKDYEYLKSIYETKDVYPEVAKNYPWYYTSQYYDNNVSCEEQLESYLNVSMADLGYDASLHDMDMAEVFYDSTVSVPNKDNNVYYTVQENTVVNGNESMYNAAVETDVKIAGVSASADNGDLILDITAEDDDTYFFMTDSGDVNTVTEYPLAFSNGMAQKTIDVEEGKSYLFSVVRSDGEGGYVKNSYSISPFSSELSNGRWYADCSDTELDADDYAERINDLLVMKDDLKYAIEDYASVSGGITLINMSDRPVDGDIVRSVFLDDGLDMTSVGFFKIQDGEFVNVSGGYSNGEHLTADIRCSIDGDGTYVLMAKPAFDGNIPAVTGLSVRAKEDVSGLYTLSFSDTNNAYDLQAYNIYYSHEPITDVNAENVSIKTVLPGSDSYSVDLLDDYGKWYFAVEAVAKDGSKSELCASVQTQFKPLDSDEDGLPDYWEARFGFEDDENAANADPDGDGLDNLLECRIGSDPLNPDTDGDNVIDGIEYYSKLDPNKKMTDGVTDDYVTVYGNPDVSIENVKNDGENITFDLNNATDGKAMNTVVSLLVDGEIKKIWTVNIDAQSVIPVSLPTEGLAGCGSFEIVVDEGHITRDSDYSNNTFTYSSADSISFDAEVYYVAKNSTLQLSPVVAPDSANELFKWSVSDDTIITVDAYGLVTAGDTLGEVDITAETLNGLTATCEIQIVPFDGCEPTDFDCELINDGSEVSIIGYIGNDTDITVPAELGGLPVTKIASIGNKNIESIVIPDSVNNVLLDAFNNAASLSAIYVDSNNDQYISKEGILYSADGTRIIRCPRAYVQKDITIDDNVTEICRHAFAEVGLTSIAFPDSLQTIRGYAFRRNNFSTITIPASVTRIESNSFARCSNLTEINYNAANAKTGILAVSVEGIMVLNSVFYLDSGVATINIGSTVQSLPTGLFMGLSGLQTVNIATENELNVIEKYVFLKDSSLSDVYYGGYYKDWKNITIAEKGNTPFTDATLHCVECDEHNWDDGVVTTEPTCIATGIRLFTCEVCGRDRSETEPVNLSNHTGGTTVINEKAASCSEEGYTGDIICSDCRTVLIPGESIEKLAHVWDDGTITQEATCTEAGVMTYKCVNCPEIKNEPINANGHTPAEAVTENPVAATCTEDGGYDIAVYCSVCGDEISRSHTIIGSTGHAYGEWTITQSPTCTENGTEQRICANDAAHVETRPINSTGHAFGDWTIKTAPTCTEEGVEQRVCANDPAHVETRPVISTGHAFGDWTIKTAPTCTEEGIEQRVCANDPAHVETRPVISTGHAFGDWTIKTAPTCTEEGVEQRVCANDPTHVETRTIGKTGHIDSDSDGICDNCHNQIGGGNSSSSGKCKWCGQAHTGFFGAIIAFFHKILYFFAHLFGKK